MNVMASWLPVDLTTSTEVCFVKGGVEGNRKTDWLGQRSFWAKLWGVQRHGASEGPLCEIPKLLLEDAQLQPCARLPRNDSVSGSLRLTTGKPLSKRAARITLINPHNNSVKKPLSLFPPDKRANESTGSKHFSNLSKCTHSREGGRGSLKSCVLDSRSPTAVC